MSGLSESALFVSALDPAELKSIFKVLLSGSDIEQQLSQACVKALLKVLVVRQSKHLERLPLQKCLQLRIAPDSRSQIVPEPFSELCPRTLLR